MAEKKPPKLKIGDRVEDVTTHERGRIVHVYSKRELRDESCSMAAPTRWPFRLTHYGA
jgi:hypothetical protein